MDAFVIPFSYQASTISAKTSKQAHSNYSSNVADDLFQGLRTPRA